MRFSSYKSGEFDLAYVGDDTGYRVAGVGDIKIKMFEELGGCFEESGMCQG